MDRGTLVPDKVIVAMMAEEIGKCPSGFVLDGFPRTAAQAESLDRVLGASGMGIDLVLNLQIDDRIVRQRMAGRISCPRCGAVYHLDNMPPKAEGVCDVDGERLVQRPDDDPEVVANRLATYHELTAPVVDYYRVRGVVNDIDAGGPTDEVTALIFSKLDALVGSCADRRAGGSD
jgi:adenylate kinase